MSGNEASARGVVLPENGKQIPFGGYIWKEYMCGVMIASRRPFIVGMSARTDQCKFHQEWRDDHEGSDVI